MSSKFKYFLIIILFFVTNDAITFGTSGNILLALFNQVVYLLLALYLIFKVKNISSNKISTLVFILFLFCVFTTFFFNQDGSLGYLIQINSLLLGYLISIKLKLKEFVSFFNKLLFYLSLLGLICFLIFILFPKLMYILPSFENVAQTKYVNLFFYAQLFEVESGFLGRNSSIFREPGVYMLYLNIGILFELFFKDKINTLYLFVYIVALITTLSTGGYMVFVFLIISYLIKVKDIKKLTTTVLLAMFLAFLMWFNFELFEDTLTKFDTESTNYGSALSRISSVTIPLAMFFDNPFGVGLFNYSQLYENYAFNLYQIRYRANGQSTNTLFGLLSTYGFTFFLLCNLAFYRLSSKISTIPLIKLIVFFSFFMLLSNQDIRYSLLFTVLLFYGFSIEFNSNKKLHD